MSNFDRFQPYNELPLLPPLVDIQTPKVLKKVISTSRALAQLNGALLALPNPTLFLDTIHLREAKASSEIENIITTNDHLFKSFVADLKQGDASTKEVLYYKNALWAAFAELEKKPIITTNLCIKIVQNIKQSTASIRTTAGTTLSNPWGEVIYTPPSGADIIRDKLANWEKFVNEDSDDIDPLIKMAVMHYQFEAIHPFADGNGRTGRILLLLYLKLTGLLAVPALYLSEYIIQHKTLYYQRLRGVTEQNDWEAYLLYMLDMVEKTAAAALQRLNEIIKLMEQTAASIQTLLPKVYSKDLIEIIFRLPYTKRQYLINKNIGTPKTVGNYLAELEKSGFLKSQKIGKEKIYINQALLQILEKAQAMESLPSDLTKT